MGMANIPLTIKKEYHRNSWIKMRSVILFFALNESGKFL